MVAGRTHAIARLNKRDVEMLLADYDLDPVAALTIAMRRVLDQPELAWPALVQAAKFSGTRSGALLVGDQGALDALAAELNELRGLHR